MAIEKISPNGSIDGSSITVVPGSQFSGQYAQPDLQEHGLARSYPMDRLSADELLIKSTRTICQKYRIEFANLSAIQRKFLTHYRCGQCGLLPLYQINLLHVKRVRCRKCGQLIGFKRKGKYGRLRKEIAFVIAKEIRDV